MGRPSEALRHKTLSELLAPAIYYAEQGFPLSVVSARSIVQQAMLKQPGYKETYTTAGEKPA